MNTKKHWQRNALALAVMASVSPFGFAQADSVEADAPTIRIAKPLEEVTVVARQRSSAEDVIAERLEYDVVTDIISSEQIVRVGDPNVASALRRVPGLTLVDDKFIYVRGLGERYSSAQLNGALVPSPDLQRNVLPLDIFPAEVIQSLAVQKVYSADMPANFGGGNVDIRTRALPDDLLVNLSIGTGWSSESTGKDGLTYAGGGDDRWGVDDGTRALPGEISQAINEYRGDISVANILKTLNYDGGFHTVNEAQDINRQIASSLNRDIDVKSSKNGADQKIKGGLGYRWGVSEDWDVGFIALGAYDQKTRNKDRVNRSASNPENNFSNTISTTDEVSINSYTSLGVNHGMNHKVDVNYLFIRNTEDEASITRGFNEGTQAEKDSGNRFVTYDLRYEQRELHTWQAKGEHNIVAAFNESIYELPLRWADEMVLNWYYSDSRATTEKPNEVAVEGIESIDVATGEVYSTRVQELSKAAIFRFTDMEDNVESYGWDVRLPLTWETYDLELSGGFDGSRKDRTYIGTSVNIDTSNASMDALGGTPGEVFGEDELTKRSNGFIASLGSAEAESYLAAQTLDAWYGKADLTLDLTWRFSGGLRRESFKQVALPIDTLDFVNQMRVSDEELEKIVVSETKSYPSLSMTYMLQNFWAEQFQFRLGYGGTTVRPDLREVAVVQYIDPVTDYRVVGNPYLETSDLQNFDARAEWFFDSGNSFTLSAFYKDIESPIETVRAPGSDDNVVLTFLNAEKASLMGVEMEWLWGLDNALEGLFVSGNLTLSDSEITITDQDIGLTNNERRMTGHSREVANIQFGYDAPSGMHSATLAYNYFGSRIAFAARDGADDAYEDPFNSLDLNYAFYPYENISLRLRLTNLLNEQRTITQDGNRILEEVADRTLSLGVKWDL
ncbi:TonB-dependent receptor plug domain-containing protein [Simiduia sp. 21SJ11W-1]|uniref:TonB-dependent receptor domain-containing protein n=1 Tax=Simiduia sp. 21SJ11W-1 TaxID=2909669 RepID=UPI00209D20EA|nr:TonB-dependent receptor [Simiduia sp. 21SJ11W-1]UTA46967.1 TonB-dependent receptor plug domain-containing protein [Simiduia sp. 21SJ11W-1]